ncbi:hypothetical protein NPIL_389101, partial [Nephila pilipes]
DNALGLLVNGHRFDLDVLDVDPLLNRINEWDYPIFDLKEQAKDLILSQEIFVVLCSPLKAMQEMLCTYQKDRIRNRYIPDIMRSQPEVHDSDSGKNTDKLTKAKPELQSE